MKIELTRSVLFAQQCIEEEVRKATPRDWGRPRLKNNPEWIFQNIDHKGPVDGRFTVRIRGDLDLKAGVGDERFHADMTAIVKKTFGVWFKCRVSGSLVDQRRQLMIPIGTQEN